MAKELSGKSTPIDKAKGFAAEQWHAGTFNVNAALNDSSNRVHVADNIRGQLGSPDIVGAAGDASLKYYKTAKANAEQQAKSLSERYNEYVANAKRNGRTPISREEYKGKLPSLNDHDPLYGGQVRIFPKEQLNQARTYLERRIKEEQGKRPELVEKYQDTLNLLQDRLKDHSGNESIPLSNSDAEKIAKVAEEGKFDPKEFGISAKDLMNWEYIKTQSLQAGLSAAAITIALRTAPEIIKIIQQLIDNNEVGPEQLRRTFSRYVVRSPHDCMQGWIVGRGIDGGVPHCRWRRCCLCAGRNKRKLLCSDSEKGGRGVSAGNCRRGLFGRWCDGRRRRAKYCNARPWICGGLPHRLHDGLLSVQIYDQWHNG